MTAILAQLISITSHGNHFLTTGDLNSDYEKENSTFQFCNRVDFRNFRKTFPFTKPKEIVIAESPIKWFHFLKKQNYSRLRLYYQNAEDSTVSDHKLAGFVGGGGKWYIEAVKDKVSDYWTSRWDVTKPDSTDSKIWTVSYGLTKKNERPRAIQKDLDSLRQNLEMTLQEIADFAFKQNLESFGKTFDSARKTLDSEQPEQNYYHKDLIRLDKYSIRAKQVLFSAASAWVFGGMGSWNDNSFENKRDNDKYEELSTRLSSCINESIVGVINSF